MQSPGDYAVLSPIAITATLTRATGVQGWLGVDLSGITAATFVFNFKYGSGGAAAPSGCSAIVQAGSSVDGSLALDIARVDFGQASRIRRVNVEGLLSVASDYADLAAEGVYDGCLLDRLRAILIVGATPYVNTTLGIIAGCR